MNTKKSHTKSDLSRQYKVVNKLRKQIAGELHLDIFAEKRLDIHLNCFYDIAFRDGARQLSHNKKIIQFKDGVVVREFESITDAAKATGVHKSSVEKNVLFGTTNKQGYTYKLRYETKDNLQ